MRLGVIKVGGVILLLLVWAYFVWKTSEDSFERLIKDLNKLTPNESAWVYSKIRLAKNPDKAFSKVFITEELKNCLLKASSNANPGDFDREMIIHTEMSNVFLRFRFLNGELQYFYRSFVNDELTLLQSEAAVYNSPCSLRDWPIVEELYRLEK